MVCCCSWTIRRVAITVTLNRVPWTPPRITQRIHMASVVSRQRSGAWTAAGQLDVVSRAEKRQVSISQTACEADCQSWPML